MQNVNGCNWPCYNPSMSIPALKVFQILSGPRSGAYNMALDELLLESLRQKESSPVLVVRTYEWECPTLSIGTNQPERDLQTLLPLYEMGKAASVAIVRRPTGGRAILHGEDISFSFITNDPSLLRQSLKDSYCTLTQFVKRALQGLGLALGENCEANTRAYLRSPVCFETHTPSDLLDPQGRKLAGSAQLRRAGGLLQHGAAFLKPFQKSPQAFSKQLFQAVAEAYGQAALAPYPFSEKTLKDLAHYEERYASEASGMLSNARTTAGSHLEPASS